MEWNRLYWAFQSPKHVLFKFIQKDRPEVSQPVVKQEVPTQAYNTGQKSLMPHHTKNVYSQANL
jgi:hypothetical protein